MPDLRLIELVPQRHDLCLALPMAARVEMIVTKPCEAVISWPAIEILNAISPSGDCLVRRLHYPRTHTLVVNFLVLGRGEGV